LRIPIPILISGPEMAAPSDFDSAGARRVLTGPLFFCSDREFFPSDRAELRCFASKCGGKSGGRAFTRRLERPWDRSEDAGRDSGPLPGFEAEPDGRARDTAGLDGARRKCGKVGDRVLFVSSTRCADARTGRVPSSATWCGTRRPRREASHGSLRDLPATSAAATAAMRTIIASFDATASPAAAARPCASSR